MQAEGLRGGPEKEDDRIIPLTENSVLCISLDPLIGFLHMGGRMPVILHLFFFNTIHYLAHAKFTQFHMMRLAL